MHALGHPVLDPIVFELNGTAVVHIHVVNGTKGPFGSFHLEQLKST